MAFTPDMKLAARLFAALEKHWDARPESTGICRASYSAEEEEAADILIAAAKEMGLQALQDRAGNYYMVLEGADPALAAIVSGSHLDSVPRGGRYDGPAGVVAPLCVFSGFLKEGYKPERTLCAMIVRGEESAWYGQACIGSRLAVGALPPEKLRTLTLKDKNTPLLSSMQALGLKAETIKPGEILFPLKETACFMELHIEQGPNLKELNEPIGIVTGIRGNIRYRSITCTGQAGHTGTVPHAMRKDAVRASAWLITTLENMFENLQSKRMDLVFTFPVATTGPAASHTTIPAHFEFALEVRSQSQAVLDTICVLLDAAMREGERRYKVQFAACDPISTTPALMDEGIQAQLKECAASLGQANVVRLPSGAGHDAAIFANAGVPAGMIFIRHNGISHAPEEDMPMEDFELGAKLLGEFFRKNALPASGNGKSFVDGLKEAGAKTV